MVLPFIALGLAARFALPLGRALLRFVIPKTVKGALVQAVAVPTAIGALSSPTVRGAVGRILDPRESLKRGRGIAEAIERLPREEKEKGLGTIAKFGLAGVGIAAVAAAVPKIAGAIPKGKPKGIAAEKPITPETQIIQTQPIAAPTLANGQKGVNVSVNVTQRQTRRHKNIAIFQ